MPTITDYLETTIGNSVSVGVVKSTWVQLTNNSTAVAYVSTTATDTAGKFTVNNVPSGSYSVATGPSATGPWTATGDTNYLIPPTAADNTSTFPGLVTVPSLTDTGLTAASIPFADTGGLLATDATLTFNKTTKVAGAGALSVSGLTGAQAGGRFVGYTAYGPPTSGTFTVGDTVISKASGSTFVCTVAGTPGTWVVGGQLFNVLDYGARFDGVTDDTTAFTNAVTAMPVGGATLFMPSGTTLVSAALFGSIPAGSRVMGSGRGATTVKLTGSLAIHALTPNAANLYFADFTLDGNASLTISAGGIVPGANCSDSVFERITVQNFARASGTYQGIWILNAGSTRLRFRDILVTNHSVATKDGCNGIYVSVANAECVFDRVRVTNVQGNGASANGFHLDTGSSFCRFIECFGDTIANGDAFRVRGSDHTFVDCRALNSGNGTLVVSNFAITDASRIKVLNLDSSGAGGSGLEVNTFTSGTTVSDVDIDGGFFYNNGVGGGSQYGIAVGQATNATDTVRDVSIRGAHCFDTRTGVARTQTSGIVVQQGAGAVHNVVVADVHLRNNITTPLSTTGTVGVVVVSKDSALGNSVWNVNGFQMRSDNAAPTANPSFRTGVGGDLVVNAGPGANGSVRINWDNGSGGIIVGNGAASPIGTATIGSLISGLTGGGRISQGSGVPITPNGVNPVAGDLFFRTDTPTIANQRIYVCTVGGGAPTWVGIV